MELNAERAYFASASTARDTPSSTPPRAAAATAAAADGDATVSASAAAAAACAAAATMTSAPTAPASAQESHAARYNAAAAAAIGNFVISHWHCRGAGRGACARVPAAAAAVHAGHAAHACTTRAATYRASTLAEFVINHQTGDTVLAFVAAARPPRPSLLPAALLPAVTRLSIRTGTCLPFDR